jgi:hypothetical protein
VERFSRDKVLLLWEQLFEEVKKSGRQKFKSQEGGRKSGNAPQGGSYLPFSGRLPG